MTRASVLLRATQNALWAFEVSEDEPIRNDVRLYLCYAFCRAHGPAGDAIAAQAYADVCGLTDQRHSGRYWCDE